MFLTLTVSTAWGAGYSKNESWSFNTSGNSNWTSVNCGSYCGGWGKNKDASPSVYKTDIQNFIDVDFSKYENVSLTIYVTAGHNSGTNSYTVKLIDKSGSQVSSYTITKTNGMGSGSNSSSAKESSVTFNPTQSFSGYRIDFYPKSYITKTRYVLTYDDKTVSYSVNWTINPTEGGSLSPTSGNSTTVTPNTAYTYGSPAYTVTSGSATVLKSGDTFTATPTANSTIQINMVEKPKYTVTLNAGPGTCAAFVTETSAGAGVELLEPTLDCGDWKFAGWATSPVEEEITEVPNFITDKPYKPTGNCTLYAVYSRIEEGSGGGNSEESVDFSKQGYTDKQTMSSYTGDDFEIAFNKGTNNNDPKYYNNGTAIRIYGGGYFTIGSESTITKIVITFGSSDGSNAITTNVGTYSNGTWTGSANSVKFTIGGSSGNRRIAGITVTTSGGSSTTYYHSTPDCEPQTPTYTITWKNSDGTTLETDKNVESGATPQYNGATPTKAATAQYTYTFAGWDPEISTVTGDQIYTAKFTETLNKYTITWKNSDGTTLKTEEVAYGTTPSYTGTIPTKAATEQYTYTHNGWTPSVVAVTGNAEYTATFAETPRTYTITLNTNGGTINAGNVTTYEYGAGATLPTDITNGNLEFAGWYDNETCDGSPVATISTTDTGNKEFWAKWEKSTPTFAWSDATYTAALEADNTFPTLDNPNSLSPVTYTSSNTGVATIDANGNITLIAAGTTTITATGAETDTHKSATAIYELNVLESNCRWVETEIEDIDSGDEVVITMTTASGVTYALPSEKFTSGAPNATSVKVDGNSLELIIPQIVWIIYKNGDNLTFESNYNQGNYLAFTNSDSGVRVNDNTNRNFVVDDVSGYLKNTQTNDARYLGVHNKDLTWYSYKTYSVNTSAQTLKFYKKTCLPANKFWIDYELANVTCTTAPPHSQIDQTGEDLLLKFSAHEGYKLPASISISIGNNILPEDNDVYIWDSENGELLIVAAQVTDNITITIEGCERLAAPTKLAFSNRTSSSVTLSWNAVQNAKSYIVYVTDGTNDITETTSECNITISGLAKNTQYTWDVIATADGYCENEHSQEWIEFTTLDSYTVTFFNSNGGTAVGSQTIDHGGKATKPADPTKTGYTFAGWYTEAECTNIFDFNTPITSPTTIYAKWNANQYTIKFLKQWGDGGTETATVHFNNNDFSVNPIIVPTRNGYTFGGYYTAESGAGTQLIDVSGAWLNAPTYIEGGKWVYADDLTLYAKWTQNFTITWMANGQLYHTQTAMMGTAIAKPDDPNANELACDDKVFVGWLDKTISGSTNEEPTFVTDFGTIQANKTYYAVFAKLTGTPSNDYNKITDINDLTDGEYVIAYSYNGGTQVVLKNTTKDAKYMNASALAPSSNKYTSPSAEYIWQLQKQDDGSYYMYNSSVNKFLYATTSALQLSDNPTKYNISYDNTYTHWKIKLSDNASYYMHGYVSGSSYDFCVSTSGSGNKYRVYLYKNASTAVYSDYVTTCVEIPTPHWEGAEIDNANIAVDCGAISFKSNASKITFDKNYDLTYPITLTASEGFLLSTNKQNDVYEQSVTVTPVQSGDNKGKITQSVHVRADATGKKTNFDGTITISGDQLAEDQIIEVHAVVDCPQYTLTFNDCGDTKTISGFAGTSVEEMEPWAETCSEPFQYVFDGWATAPVTNGTEEYEKVDFSTFTMPNNNTTILYAVYRYAEEGGEPVNGYVKVTEALTDWSGDYVIVDDEFNVAIQNTYEEDTKDNKTLKDVSVTIKNDKIVSPTNDIIWTISKYGEYYTVYNAEAIKYAGITKNETRAAGLSETIATGYSMNIIFDSNTKIAKVSSTNYNRCFSYSESYPEWRTYSNNDAKGKTGYLYRFSNKTIRYTSSLVCGTITAEDALVTSTKDQKVKVKVPITLDSSTGATTINATSDNAAFDVTGLTDVEAGDHTIVVEYTPAEYNITETANITLSATNGATTTFTVSGRSLPENFVIATKVGATWYALPANMNGATNPEGVVIDVDETTMTATAPNTTVYTLFPVATINGNSDRYKEYGERLRFAAVNNGNKGLWANNADNGTKINNDAAITAANSTAGAAYEWKITTTIVDGNWQYTLQTYQSNNQKYLRYYNSKWGTYVNGENDLYFLPVTEVEPFEMQVVEWYPTKVLVQTEATLATISATIGGEEVAEPVVTQKGGKLYEISNLPLETNPTKLLAISYTADEITYANNTVIPIIISRAEKNIVDEPFATLTADVYNSADLVVRDGAVLTVNGTEKANTFANVTIYPTAKISVPAMNKNGANNKLSVNSLTFFGGIDEIYDGSTYTINKYGVPELSLKGLLNKTTTQMDYIMRVDLDQMYSLTVPYDVQLADIKYWDGTNIVLGDELWVSAYDGQARANRESKTWVYETDFATKFGSATLKAGVGYTISAELQAGVGNEYSILRMPMMSNVASGATEAAKTVAVTAWGKDANVTDNHKGWNLVGNPYMTTIQGADDDDLVLGYLKETGTGPWEWVNDDIRYVTIPSDDGTYYWQQRFTTAELPPFKNFFVQIGTTGELAFGLGTRQSMPARSTQAAIEKEVEFEILMSNDARQDNTGLLIAEQYSPAYEINADLEKMIGSMSVYTIYGGYNLAYNAISPINASEWIPMGYIAPAAGEYTFSLDDVENIAEQVEHVYIIDYNANNIVDLMDDEYEFTTDKEQNNNRFAINIVLIQDKDNTTTGLDMIQGNNAAPIKFIHQDKMYIYNEGIIYDATGKQVTNINK